VFVTSNHFKIKNAFRIGDKHNPEDKTLYPSDHYGLLVDLELQYE